MRAGVSPSAGGVGVWALVDGAGYLTTLVVAMIPPLWHHLMTPKVLAWDRDFATPAERALAARASARSGSARFVQAAATAG